jgi:hypothetical protein
MFMKKFSRSIVLILACSLAVGAAEHWLDIFRSGFFPYTFAPQAINIFWTALAFVDVLAVYLLLRHLRLGLTLTLIIMVLDVGINSYAAYGLDLFPHSWLWPLQLQTLFLGFSLGSAGFLWPRYSRPLSEAS